MIPDNKKLEILASGKSFKYKLGEVVFLKTDLKRKYPMLIVNFKTENEYTCNDYFCTWLNSQGTKEQEGFPQECLTQ